MSLGDNKDIRFLILQFCEEEENLKQTARMLEQEAGDFFNLKYFGELVLNANWEDAEKYFSSFTKIEDNQFSWKIYFGISKQKYLEALDQHDFDAALDIFRKQLKFVANSNKQLYGEMAKLLALDSFREEGSSFSLHGGTLISRGRLSRDLKTVIGNNPILMERITFPQINKSRLKCLINQSLLWQHNHCAHPHPQPHTDTLFIDHECIGRDKVGDGTDKENSLSLRKDIIFLILQFCEEENLKKTARILEQETGYVFNLKYFGEMVLNGNWEDAEKYISGFTKIEDNEISWNIYFKMRKQKYLEALDHHDFDAALDILRKQLKFVANSNQQLYGEMAKLLALDSFREKDSLFSLHGGMLTARRQLLDELTTAIGDNPLLLERMNFQQINKSRLKCLIDQSLHWQRNYCAHPHPQSCHSGTLFTNHKCIGRDKLQEGTDKKSSSIRKLVHANAFGGILALSGNGTCLFWKWLENDTNFFGEANTMCTLQLCQSSNKRLKASDMYTRQLWESNNKPLKINDLPAGNNILDVVPCCCDLSTTGSYFISASGNMITLYEMSEFKKLKNIALPTLEAATCIILYPLDNDCIIVGLEDSTIIIYHMPEEKVIRTLEGHSGRITGLAFSTTLHELISSGVDAQIVLWDRIGNEKNKSTVLQVPIGWPDSDLRIELDKDEKQFLAVHESQLAIYEIKTLHCMKQWTVENFHERISHATFSCDSMVIYAVRTDGVFLLLGASNLSQKYKIDPSAYLPSDLRSSDVYPVVLAAHRLKPYQLAMGLSNGGVIISELSLGLLADEPNTPSTEGTHFDEIQADGNVDQSSSCQQSAKRPRGG